MACWHPANGDGGPCRVLRVAKGRGPPAVPGAERPWLETPGPEREAKSLRAGEPPLHSRPVSSLILLVFPPVSVRS